MLTRRNKEPREERKVDVQALLNNSIAYPHVAGSEILFASSFVILSLSKDSVGGRRFDKLSVTTYERWIAERWKESVTCFNSSSDIALLKITFSRNPT